MRTHPLALTEALCVLRGDGFMLPGMNPSETLLFAACTAWVESRWDPSAVSTAGAMGLFQVLEEHPGWAGLDPASPGDQALAYIAWWDDATATYRGELGTPYQCAATYHGWYARGPRTVGYASAVSALYCGTAELVR